MWRSKLRLFTALAALLSVLSLNGPSPEVVAFPLAQGGPDEIVEPIRAFGLGAVTSVAFSPDGERALLGSSAGFAVLVDLDAGAFERYFFGHTDEVSAVAISPDGTKALTGSYDGTAKLWDLSTGALLQTFTGHTETVTSVAFSPDGAQVLTASEDNSARLWNASDGSLIRAFTGHTDDVNAVAFSPDGAQVLTGSSDDTARLWSASDGSLVRAFDVGANVTSVAFSPDGDQILTGDGFGYAKLWNASTGDLIRSVDAGDWDTYVAFSPDGDHFVTGSADYKARLWETATGSLVHTFTGHTSRITSVAFSPDGDQILTGSYDKTARLWDVSTGETVRTLQGFRDSVDSAAYSPDGTMVALVSEDKVWLMDAVTGETVHVFDPGSSVYSVAFSPDGGYLLAGGASIARLWDVSTGEIVRTFSTESSIVAVAFSPDGARILTGDYDQVTLWDVSTGNPVCVLGTEGVPTRGNSVAFSPDGSQAMTGHGQRHAYLWDLSTCTKVLTLTVGGTLYTSVNAVGFSPDGSELLTGDSTGMVTVWDASTGNEIRALTGHSDKVYDVAFSPDGSAILSAAGNLDKTARLWDAFTGEAMRIFRGHANAVNAAVFSSDQTRLLTASDDATARMWDSGLPAFSYRQPVTLTLGAEAEGVAFYRQYADYVLEAEAGRNLLVQVTPVESSTLRVYGRFGARPSAALYDDSAPEPTPDGRYYLLFSPTLDGPYYFGVLGQDKPSSRFRIVARYVDRFLADVSPRSAGNGGEATLHLRGLGFTDGMDVELRGSSTLTATEVTVPSPTEMWARFNLAGAATGAYDVAAIWPGGQEEALTGTLQVTTGAGPDLTASFQVPGAFRGKVPSTLSIRYANAGDADAEAPLFIVSTEPDRVPLRTVCDDGWVTGTVQVLGVNPSIPAGTLPPGAESTVSVIFWGIDEGITFRLYQMRATGDLVNWEQYRDQMRPREMSEAEWDAIWPTLKANLGDTWADYLRVLHADAERLRQRGQANHCVRDLLALEIQKAKGEAAAIAGRLLNADTGEPLGNVLVAAYKDGGVFRTAVTDPLDGHFVLEALPDGLYEIRASRYEITPSVTVEITDGADVTGLTLFARPSTGLLAEKPFILNPSPPVPPEEPVAEEVSEFVHPHDPNEKVGPQGTVAVSDTLRYAVYFENESSATAPAQEVEVVDYLDPDLDWSTFRFEEAAFGSRIIPTEGTTEFYVRQVITDYRETMTKTWWVDITGDFNPDTGRVEWTFRTLDPETGEPPTDPLAGFLPPNNDTGRGEGHVAFSIRPRAASPSGTELTNRATIVFDTEEAIATNEVSNVVGSVYKLYLPLVLRGYGP